MRRGFMIIFFMFLLNTATVLVNGLPIWGGIDTGPQYNSSQLTDSLNSTELGDNWDPPESGGLFGDVKAAIQMLKRLNNFITAFPQMWADLSLPAYLVAIFGDVWAFVWWLSILDLISGGKIFGS